jgi:ABC-2 type transport system permease protein
MQVICECNGFGRVRRVAANEIRLTWRRKVSWCLLASLVVLVAVASILSFGRHEREQRRQAAFDQLVREQWEGQPDRHPHRVAHYGSFAFKPKAALSAYDPGVDSQAGRIRYLEAHRQNALAFSEASGFSSVSVLGELSPAYVMEMCVPLIIVLLGYGAFAGEKESGRASLIRASGLSAKGFWTGKFVGLLVALLPFFVIGGLAICLLGGSFPAGLAAEKDLVLRLSVLLGGLALYWLLWLALVLAVSGWCRTAGSALTTLMGIWVMVSIVTPRAASGVAAWLHPLPDKSEFAAKIANRLDRLGDSHDPTDPVFAQFKDEVLRQHGVSRVEDLPFNYKGLVMAKGEEQSAQAFSTELAALRELEHKQSGVINLFSWLSPPLAMKRLSMLACGTDPANHHAFEDQSEAYRYAFVQKLNHLQQEHISYAGNSNEKLGSEHWAHFERFQMVAPRMDAGGLLRSAMVLGVWLALGLGAGIYGIAFRP